MTVIDTSTAGTATAYSNQRKIDRCQNGVLWATYGRYSSSDKTTTNFIETRYSTDDGSTWSAGTPIPNASGFTGANYTPNHSFFIDLDDYAHVVFKDNSNGFIYYRRGTPNAGRTAWTWSAATVLRNFDGVNYPDVIAHREGTGWKAHVVSSERSGTSNWCLYQPVDITSGGTVTVGSSVYHSNYFANADTFPSIDFNHTGDGKTVAGGTPHLYAAWSAGTTGSGRGIRFKKATYSGGSWTWGTEREIDSTRYSDGFYRIATCLFDGTRVIIAGSLLGTTSDQMLYERDAADTTTTTITLAANPATSDALLSGNATYDADGNVYIFGGEMNATGGYTVGYRKWTRSTSTWGSWTLVGGGVTNGGSSFGFATAKRGYSNGLIEFVYTDGTANPYSVTYGSLTSLTPLGKDIDLRWSLRSALAGTIDVRWALRAAVNDSIDLRWGIRTPIFDTLDLRWALRSAVGDSADLRWALKAAIADSLDARWSIRSAVADEFDARWGVRTAVGDELDLRWQVLALLEAITNSLDLRWAVKAAVADELDARWSLRQALNDSLDVRWGIRNAAAVPLDLRWGVRMLVADDVDVRWGVRSVAGNAADLRWNLNQIIGRTANLRWSLRSMAAAASDLRWSIRSLSDADLELVWRVMYQTNPLATDLELLWNVFANYPSRAKRYARIGHRGASVVVRK